MHPKSIMDCLLKITTTISDLVWILYTKGMSLLKVAYNLLPCMCRLSADDSHCHLYIICGLSTEDSN